MSVSPVYNPKLSNFSLWSNNYSIFKHSYPNKSDAVKSNILDNIPTSQSIDLSINDSLLSSIIDENFLREDQNEIKLELKKVQLDILNLKDKNISDINNLILDIKQKIDTVVSTDIKFLNKFNDLKNKYDILRDEVNQLSNTNLNNLNNDITNIINSIKNLSKNVENFQKINSKISVIDNICNAKTLGVVTILIAGLTIYWNSIKSKETIELIKNLTNENTQLITKLVNLKADTAKPLINILSNNTIQDALNMVGLKSIYKDIIGGFKSFFR